MSVPVKGPCSFDREAKGSSQVAMTVLSGLGLEVGHVHPETCDGPLWKVSYLSTSLHVLASGSL